MDVVFLIGRIAFDYLFLGSSVAHLTKSGDMGACASVACHQHGTALSGFLPASWDHLDCQSWDHPARLTGRSLIASLTHRVRSPNAEVVEGGIQGGQRG